jgi:hypothetical protein
MEGELDMNIGGKIKAVFRKIFFSHKPYYPNEYKETSKIGDYEVTKLNTKNRHDFFNS